MDKRTITHSEIQSTKCWRKRFLSYGLCLEPIKTAVALRIGGVIHDVLDIKKRALKNGIDGDNIQKTMQQEIYNSLQPMYYSDEIDWQIIIMMLWGYNSVWDNSAFEVIESELEFCLPIINPDTGRTSKTMQIAGKIDGIIRFPDGRLAILEHKTTSSDISINSDLWRYLRIDNQISMYYIAAQQMGYNVETVYYDVLRKPSFKPYKATPSEKRKYKADGQLYKNQHDTNELPNDYGKRISEDITKQPEAYYARREIPRLEADIYEFRQELWQNAILLREHEKTMCYPRKTDICRGFNLCQFFDLCTSGYDINSGEIPEGYKVKESLHTELGELNGNTQTTAADNADGTQNTATTNQREIIATAN